MWRKRKKMSKKYSWKNLWTVNFHFTDPQYYLHMIRTFLNHTKNETLDEIEASLENCGNKWSSYLSFSNTHSCSFWNGSVWFELAESAVGRVVLLQLLSMRNGAVGVTNLGVMLLWARQSVVTSEISISIIRRSYIKYLETRGPLKRHSSSFIFIFIHFTWPGFVSLVHIPRVIQYIGTKFQLTLLFVLQYNIKLPK